MHSEDEAQIIISQIRGLLRSLGDSYRILFDHSYEMAANPSKCLVHELDEMEEIKSREICDMFLVTNRVPLMKRIKNWPGDEWDKVDRCVAL